MLKQSGGQRSSSLTLIPGRLRRGLAASLTHVRLGAGVAMSTFIGLPAAAGRGARVPSRKVLMRYTVNVADAQRQTSATWAGSRSAARVRSGLQGAHCAFLTFRTALASPRPVAAAGRRG